jgi:hypothetical protein
MEAIDQVEATLPLLREKLADTKARLTSEVSVTRRDAELEIIDLEKEIDRISNERENYFKKNSELLYRFSECEVTKKKKMYTMDDIKSMRSIIHQSTKPVSEKYLYYQKFRSNIDQNYVYAPENTINEENYCFNCDTFRVLNPDTAVMTCEKCGAETTDITNPERPSLKEPPADSHYYQYKRYTHFCDCLANLQGKESSVVPPAVINTVILEIKKARMEHRVDELTEEDIRSYLKKHSEKKYDRFYDHATQILFKITDIQPIQMSHEMEHNLKVMFIEIQEPFELFKNGRRNFSSYSYILYKFCQLLGYKEFLPKLKLHKNYLKLHEHDMIWKKICNYMGGAECGWEFIKSYEY